MPDLNLSEAFAILNPPDTWLESEVACPHCSETMTVKLPREVRMTEWFCKFCKKSLTIYISDGGEMSARE